MSTLIAVAYPNEATARQARETLQRLQTEHLIELDDAVIAFHEGDKIRLDQVVNLGKRGALGGAVWGGLIGLIFLVPVAGIAVGAASGAIAGHFSDYGIEDNFVKDVSQQLKPGSAGLFLLVRSATPDRVLAEMQQYGGTILRTNLSTDAEERLQAALAGQSTQSTQSEASPDVS